MQFFAHDLVRKPLYTFRDHAFPHTWTAQPNPAWLPGEGLIGEFGFDAAPSMSFTPFALAARYGSDESAGSRLPANVSRNTPATEAGEL
jgi:hypothetical protein